MYVIAKRDRAGWPPVIKCVNNLPSAQSVDFFIKKRLAPRGKAFR